MAGNIRIQGGNAPVTPPSGYVTLYVDSSDSHIKQIDSTGTIVDLTEGSIGVMLSVRNNTGSAINKGSPVAISGFDDTNNLPEVVLANASSASTMPCIGLVDDTILSNGSGTVMVQGQLSGLNTNSRTENEELYVGASAGSLVNTRPTGQNNLIQKIGVVGKVSATEGSIILNGITDFNSLPNLQEDYIWIGDSNGVPQPVNSSTISGSTDLSVSTTSTTVTVVSSTGDDAEIPRATTSKAGVISASDQAKVDGLPDVFGYEFADWEDAATIADGKLIFLDASDQRVVGTVGSPTNYSDIVKIQIAKIDADEKNWDQVFDLFAAGGIIQMRSVTGEPGDQLIFKVTSVSEQTNYHEFLVDEILHTGQLQGQDRTWECWFIPRALPVSPTELIGVSGNSKYVGTNSSGELGAFDFPTTDDEFVDGASFSGAEIILSRNVGSDLTATMPNATSSEDGAMSSEDKSKLNRYDPAADDVREVFNVENEQTVGSGGAIAVGDLLVVAGVEVQTNAGVEYIGVVRDNGAALSDFYLPEGIAIKAIPLNGRAEEGMMTKGVVEITQSGLGNRAVGDKLYVEKTGTGSSEKWQFTIQDHPDSHHVGRVMNYSGTGNTYVVFLDFTLVKAIEHVDKAKKIVQDPVFSIVNALPASPSEGDRHITTASGTNQYKIAQRVGSSWVYSDTPSEGWLVYVENEDSYYKFVTSWVSLVSGEQVDFSFVLSAGNNPSKPLGGFAYAEMCRFVIDNSRFELTGSTMLSQSFISPSLFFRFQSIGGGTTYSDTTISTSDVNGIYEMTAFSSIPSASTENLSMQLIAAFTGSSASLYGFTLHARYR